MIARALGAFVFLAVLFLIGVAIWMGPFLLGPAQTEKRNVLFEVPPGSFRSVARALEEAGLVRDADKFRYLAVLSGRSEKVRVGEYEIPSNSTPWQVLSILVSGKSVEYQITVQEGKNLYEIAQLIEEKKLGRANDFLKLCRDPQFIRELLGENKPSLEGYLFPNTYAVTKFTGLRKLVTMMVEQFVANYSKEIESRARAMGWTRHQVVIMASIIEKETGAVDERRTVSSVYHNRLRKGMRLQADPTVIYGVWEKTGRYKENITREDLVTPTRYNTYTESGLPFGPIANPGYLSLLAAVQPETTRFLFFVSRNDGTHKFSESYEEHNQAVKAFQLDRKAREGKSWRDLSRKQAGGSGQ